MLAARVSISTVGRALSPTNGPQCSKKCFEVVLMILVNDRPQAPSPNWVEWSRPEVGGSRVKLCVEFSVTLVV